MTQPFGAAYADVYDALYADKDYEGECDALEEAFRRFGDGRIERILDLGCGTGGHALPLATRGYRMTGVDISREMLERAKRKAASVGTSVEWRVGDVRDLHLPHEFDAAILMFAVLSLQPANDDVLAALESARRHVRDGGLLVFDVWYGPGVLLDPPTGRSKRILKDGAELVRSARAELDVRRQLCRVRYRLEQEGRKTAEETQVVRFFFPAEIELFLTVSGFELIALTPAWALDEEPDERTWSVTGVARATAPRTAPPLEMHRL